MAHDLAGDADLASSIERGGSSLAVGKRSLTDRLQRKAATASASSEPAPIRWSDPSLPSGVSYVDSILGPVQRNAKAPTAGPSADDRGNDFDATPAPVRPTAALHGRVTGHSVVGGRLKLLIGLGSAQGAYLDQTGHLVREDGQHYNTFELVEVQPSSSATFISDNADNVHRYNHVVLDPPAPSGGKPVQRVQDRHSGLDDEQVHAAAARGLAGPGASLPHHDAIQRAFGPHDVGGIVAHVGGAARDANDAIGGRAYATGNHVAFADAPDLHTAAHEAAHVVQQRSGVHLKGGVGEAGDPYERHADAVADAVVRGESAAALLGDVHHGGASAIQRKDTSTIVDGADTQVAVEEDELISTFLYYTNLSHFRSGSNGPAHPRAQQSAAMHALAEDVRQAIILYTNFSIADHKRKALDRWGPARTKVLAVLWRADQRGVNTDKARRAILVADANFAGDVADDTIAEATHHIDIANPDAGYLIEAQKVVDLAINETMNLYAKAKGPMAAQLAAKMGGHGGVPFETWYQLVHSTPDLSARVKKAKESGLLAKTESASDLLTKILKATKYTVSAVNAVASVAMPAIKAEVKTVFDRFAQLAGDEVKAFGNVISVGLALIDIARGTVGLIDGILKGDVHGALKGVEHLMKGGVSLGMLAVGAGVGASTMAGALVAIWIGTLDAIVDVGALLRDMRRIQTLDATFEFVTRCSKFAHEGAELAGAVQVMMTKQGVTSDVPMQNEVEERVEARAMALTTQMVKRLKWISDELVTRKDEKSVGHYRDIVDAIGARAKNVLDNSYLMQDNPLTAAEDTLLVFNGIERMGRYAITAYGDQRESKESTEENRRLRGEIAEEQKR